MLRPKGGATGRDFTPLLRTGTTGGTIPWSDVVQQSFMGISGINPRRRHIPTGLSYTIAARLTGEAPGDTAADKTKDDPAKKSDAKTKDAKPEPAAPSKINVIAVADLDFIGEQFFEIRRRKVEDLDFDNVTFVLNSVDVLSGDESFVGLRKKRPRHRTLEVLEAQAKQFNDELQEQTRTAENDAADELDKAQKAFEKDVEQVRNRTDWDERTKEIQLTNLQQVAQRRLDVNKQNIEDRKLNKIRESKAAAEEKRRADRELRPVRSGGHSPPPPVDPGDRGVGDAPLP